MKTLEKLAAVALAVATTTLSAALEAKAATLTGAVLYHSDGSGDEASPLNFADTRGADEGLGTDATNLFLTESLSPAAFLNFGDSGATTNIGLALPAGSQDRYFFAEKFMYYTGPFYTLSLFFDGEVSDPGISAVYDLGTSTFVAGAGANARGLDQSLGNPAGGLSFVAADGTVVSLTALTLTLGSTFDLVSGSGLGASGLADDLVTFRLSVAPAVPEPSAIGFLGVGVSAMLARRRAAPRRRPALG